MVPEESRNSHNKAMAWNGQCDLGFPSVKIARLKRKEP
jgi:hypothetical protein